MEPSARPLLGATPPIPGKFRSRKRRWVYHSHPGEKPGASRPRNETCPTRVRYHHWSNGRLESLSEEAFWGRWPDGITAPAWVEIEGLKDTARIHTIGKRLGLHELTLEDITAVPQQPKCEIRSEYLLVLTRMLTQQSGSLEPEQISMVRTRKLLLTVREGRNIPLAEFSRKLLADSFPEEDTEYLMYRLLDFVVDSYFPLLGNLDARLFELEEQVVFSRQNHSIREIYNLKNDIMDLRRTVFPHREILRLIHTRRPEGEETDIRFRDIADHINQLLELVDFSLHASSNLMELHLSIASSHLNQIMKVLTVIAALFVPLTLISGIYGMNFDPSVSPWNMPELKWEYGYPFALLLMAGVAMGMYFYFKKLEWI